MLYKGAYGPDGRTLMLIEQERRHMHELWFSPEGPKKKQPLWSSLHYKARQAGEPECPADSRLDGKLCECDQGRRWNGAVCALK